MDSLKNFRVNVAIAMRAKGMSYRALAEAAGMGYPFLNRIVTGKANPSIDVADKLADALGVQLSQLLEESPPRKIPISA